MDLSLLEVDDLEESALPPYTQRRSSQRVSRTLGSPGSVIVGQPHLLKEQGPKITQ